MKLTHGEHGSVPSGRLRQGNQIRLLGTTQECEDNLRDSLRRFKADMFQALAHPTRIAILEMLGAGELSAGSLIEKLGFEQATVSQHLAVLRGKQIVTNRKAGNQVFYSVRDPLILEVLDLMRRYFHAHLKESMGMLDEMEKQPKAVR